MKKNLLCPNTSLDCVSVPGAGSQTHLLVCAWNSSSTYGVVKGEDSVPLTAFTSQLYHLSLLLTFRGEEGAHFPKSFLYYQRATAHETLC